MAEILVKSRPSLSDELAEVLSTFANTHGVDALEVALLTGNEHGAWIGNNEQEAVFVSLVVGRQYIADYRAAVAKLDQQEHRRWQIRNDIRVAVIAAGLALVASIATPVVARLLETTWPTAAPLPPVTTSPDTPQ